MRVMLVFALTLSISVLSAVVTAGKPQPLDLTSYFGFNQGPGGVIEKQSWWLDGTHADPNHTVINPGTETFGRTCTWDINDHSEFSTGTRFLGAGASTSREDCHLFDFDPVYRCDSGTCAWWSGTSNWVGLRVDASSPDIKATICVAPQGTCFTVLPVYDVSTHLYVYSICAQARYAPDDPAVQDIVGSNGGRGMPTVVTRTVTNPTTRTIKTVTASWGLTSDVVTTPGCPSYATPSWTWPTRDVYPWRWIGERM